MILEGLITTLNADDSPHVAPMGPRVDGTDFTSFVLRPFPTSHTYQNLLRHPAGVLHVIDDALLLARAAIGRVETFPPHRPATKIRGVVLANCVRWYEFRVAEIDDRSERVTITAEVVSRGDGRPWFGFNRARHAILEAAILASRVHLLPREQLQSEFAVLQTIVNKTGGPDELEAMRLLTDFVTS